MHKRSDPQSTSRVTDTASFMLERGLQYNVFGVDGKAVGYLINQKIFDTCSGEQIGSVDPSGNLVQHDHRVGIVRGMEIVMNDGAVLTLVRVPF